MDTAIQDGDFRRDSGGLPVQIGGREELLQRAYLQLQMKRGSFPYAPRMGSGLSLLPPEKRTAEAAMACVEEAIGGCPSLTAVDTAVTKDGVAVTVDTACGRGTVWIRTGE